MKLKRFGEDAARVPLRAQRLISGPAIPCLAGVLFPAKLTVPRTARRIRLPRFYVASPAPVNRNLSLSSS